MDKPTFVYETYIDTTAEKVWEALTSPDFTEKYWGGRRIQSDWEEGSEIKHIRPDGDFDWHGKVLQVDRPKLLSYTFFDTYKKEETKVTFHIIESDSIIRLKITHEFKNKIDPQVRAGWAAIISSLKSLLETGSALPGSDSWDG